MQGEYFIENDFNPINNQSLNLKKNLKTSFINQLLSITHEIYKFFNEGYEIRGVFLGISKDFDRV